MDLDFYNHLVALAELYLYEVWNWDPQARSWQADEERADKERLDEHQQRSQAEHRFNWQGPRKVSDWEVVREDSAYEQRWTKLEMAYNTAQMEERLARACKRRLGLRTSDGYGGDNSDSGGREDWEAETASTSSGSLNQSTF